MFDPDTAAFLRSAPPVPGLEPESIPALLTQRYAELASSRMRDGEFQSSTGGWSLERIADTYELVASTHSEHDARSASAFVAGTARQIQSRRDRLETVDDMLQRIDRDRVDPSLTAAVLFLMAEQYGDAYEAGVQIGKAVETDGREARAITEHLADLARGRPSSILERAESWRVGEGPGGIEERALAALLETIATGVELLAAEILQVAPPAPAAGRFDSSSEAFGAVVTASVSRPVDARADPTGLDLGILYPGPFHLASLLSAADGTLRAASLMNEPPPDGVDEAIWHRWLRFRCEKFPFVWPNHRSAVADGFHRTGTSAVVVLPTGAGKTTMSSLKIAGALASGKKVAFIAPTHALVEQLTEDLQAMFPPDVMESVVSNDFDLLMNADSVFQDIEVMTPERCLAMLSFAPEAFDEVGLLVFDECHLLSPQAGRIRRALDAMLCLLAFVAAAPNADLLLLSAMVRNGEELAAWLQDLTGRRSIWVDLLWKPSRQARGVVIYDEDELSEAGRRAWEQQHAGDRSKGRRAKDLRTTARRELRARPFGIWGLQHNWHSESERKAWCITTALIDEQVPLAGSIASTRLRLKPNANSVAGTLAATAARRGLKTIVFVNTKRDAVSVADAVARDVGDRVNPSTEEQRRWDALEAELGGLEHSLLTPGACAVAHNGSMLRLERDIAERTFKRRNGANVIVATPTLAQGLNLPAELAILAGDKRADLAGGRQELQAHEILNAAARAGRAGHLANGLVLLIPEPIISFRPGETLSPDLMGKLKAILPEDDHCVTVFDPLENILDRLMEGRATDPDVEYTVNRMALLSSSDDASETGNVFNLRKSLGHHMAAKRAAVMEFEAKIGRLQSEVARRRLDGVDDATAILSSQSGLAPELLLRLKSRIRESLASLPDSVLGWLNWTINWLKEDIDARTGLLEEISDSILACHGTRRGQPLDAVHLDHLSNGLQAWVRGEDLRSIETILGGKPDDKNMTRRTCPRARALAMNVIPRGISFALGLVGRTLQDVVEADGIEGPDRNLIDLLGTLVRRGFESPEMLSYAMENPRLLGRVEVHRSFGTRFDAIFDLID